ncbi:hypothetical protein HDV57DRAFT_344425 [Trichoderma longibrachiatum]|uniref:Uncharacterized protein n=1 Tax=Trichoderma longibrachiatum ATCC 18648 TaxID=983965 RepID=A0A2T4BYC9_TRILO|nr:hypothetical protein M440DRAFT_111043 [Trichoderma longibrachiatum ATCC 18648]
MRVPWTDDEKRNQPRRRSLLRIASVDTPGSPTGDPSSSPPNPHPLTPRQIPPSVACETTVQGLQQDGPDADAAPSGDVLQLPGRPARRWILASVLLLRLELASHAIERRPRPSLSTVPPCTLEPCPQPTDPYISAAASWTGSCVKSPLQGAVIPCGRPRRVPEVRVLLKIESNQYHLTRALDVPIPFGGLGLWLRFPHLALGPGQKRGVLYTP